jgi:hypothetical protein
LSQIYIHFDFKIATFREDDLKDYIEFSATTGCETGDKNKKSSTEDDIH